MLIRDHLEKASRIEGAFRSLNPEEDYEMVIEGYMLAGTHYVNAALHAVGVTHRNWDQLHSDRPDLESFRRPPDTELKVALAALKVIEDVRPRLVRGTEPCRTSMMELTRAYRVVKEVCLRAAEGADDR